MPLSRSSRRDLVREFPGIRGFSSQNLWRMQQFYLAHSSPEFLSQAVRELRIKRGGDKLSQAVRELLSAIPWGHHANALAKVSDPASRLYYIRATAHFGWSRDVLLNQIKAQAYERAVKEKKSHNFTLALPRALAKQADEILKSRYNLEFLGIGQAVRERDLENRLIDALHAFILELGYGFCFVGRQHRLAIGRKEYFVDLLFYHRFLKTLVAFDLKIGPFEPEHAGKMDFYLNLLNEKERARMTRPRSVSSSARKRMRWRSNSPSKPRRIPSASPNTSFSPGFLRSSKGVSPAPGSLPRSSGKRFRQGSRHGQEIQPPKNRRNPQARDGQAQKHPHG